MDATSGISAAAFAAAFNVNVTSEVTVGMVASSSGSASVVYSYTPPPPITLTCPAGSGTTGAPYISALVATGGVPPYMFSITSGSLPQGSSLNNATGELKGPPTTVGTFNFTAQVVDSTGTAAGTTTANCAITTTTPVFRTGWRRAGPPLPQTGGCPNTAATVPHYTTYTTYTTPAVIVVNSPPAPSARIVVGGYAVGYPPAVPSAQVVVVNEIPRVVVRESPQDYQPSSTPYFIAFTDSSVRLADAYWVGNDTLYYVTSAHALEQAPLNSLDRTLSQRLNCEKNLPFYLPGESQ
jgi:hypothetical protein